MINDVVVKDAGKKGKGVFALRSFKKGELIFRNKVGRTITDKQLPTLTKWEGLHLNELDKDRFEILRPPGCYINHSCDPNSINKGKRGKSVYALKAIHRGEEITGDYRINAFFGNRWRCYCGSKNCTGLIKSDFFSMPPHLQKKYLPYTLKFLRDEYKRRHASSKLISKTHISK